jgi:hypothetical protein
MTDTAVSFNYATWIARYPEFKELPAALAQEYFNEAGLYWSNNTQNPSFKNSTLGTLLNMLTAHIAQLNAAQAGGQQANQLVGRIASAGEGSVNVSTEWKGSGSPSEDWFVQTKYGAAFWQATAAYRTARYFANPVRVYGGAYPLVVARGRQ